VVFSTSKNKVRGELTCKEAEREFEYLSNNPDYIPDPEIEELMEEAILRAQKDPELLAHRLRNNTAASPRDAEGI